jgi:hypothetical protein
MPAARFERLGRITRRWGKSPQSVRYDRSWAFVPILRSFSDRHDFESRRDESDSSQMDSPPISPVGFAGESRPDRIHATCPQVGELFRNRFRSRLPLREPGSIRLPMQYSASELLGFLTRRFE